jgi:hypothetical protein
MPAAARKAKPKTRRELCEELLDLRRDPMVAAAIDRMDAIKSELKDMAGSQGKFRETFVGIGYVSASPATPEHTIGQAPVLDVSAWTTLTDAKREKLTSAGLVKIEPMIKGAYHGRVDVKLHTQGAAV